MKKNLIFLISELLLLGDQPYFVKKKQPFPIIFILFFSYSSWFIGTFCKLPRICFPDISHQIKRAAKCIRCAIFHCSLFLLGLLDSHMVKCCVWLSLKKILRWTLFQSASLEHDWILWILPEFLLIRTIKSTQFNQWPPFIINPQRTSKILNK